MKQKLNCVLLIDDDRATNFLNRWVIERLECAEKIKTTQSATQALEFLQKLEKGKYPQPDLILLDINMPIMSGWDFIEEYKKLSIDQKGKIILVMLTTSPNPDDLTRAESIPEINGYERKPLTVKSLEALLKKYFWE